MLLLLLIQRERQSTFWNDRYQSCFYFTRPLAPRRRGEVQQHVYQVHNVDELKQQLVDVWHRFEQSEQK